MKTRVVFAMLLVLCGSSIAFAQKSETLDIITFTPPKGWQREASRDAIQFGIEDQNGNMCLIMMFKPVPGGEDPKANFDAAWENIVEEAVTVRGKPQMQASSVENGWTVENGLGQYESDGKSGVVLLVTISGDKKMVNIVVLANSDAFQDDISAFLGSVDLPKIPPRTGTSPGASVPESRSAVQPRNDGYTFNTTNWDDGWTSVAQEDWILVHKGQMRVHLLYALPFNASQFSGTGVRARDYYWDTFVSKYFAIQTKQYRDEDSIGSLNAEYVEGWAVDRQTGEKRFIAMYLSIAPNTAFLKIAAGPDEKTLRQYFPNSHKKDQSDLDAMDRYNQFSIAANDIIGTWTDGNVSTAHWYYISPAGYESYAGMTIASTGAVFNFGKGGTYTSQHSGTTGSVGNLSSFRQNYKGTYKVSNWSVTATNRWQGKTDDFKAHFKVVRGGRILVLKSGGANYSLVRTK